MKGIFVTGTDTDVGKTVAAGILTQHLKATYWKPVQAGTDPTTDSLTVAGWLGEDRVLPERHVLQAPRSPNQAAAREGRRLELADFTLPHVDGPLVVEGAGGLLVPLNDRHLMIDLIAQLGLPAVLVARSGLGTLNHTLLSVAALKQRDIPLLGILLNGDAHEDNTRDLQHFGQVPILGRIPRLDSLHTGTFTSIASDWKIDL